MTPLNLPLPFIQTLLPSMCPDPSSHTVSTRDSVTLGPSSAGLGSVGASEYPDGSQLSTLEWTPVCLSNWPSSFQKLGEPTSQHLSIGRYRYSELPAGMVTQFGGSALPLSSCFFCSCLGLLKDKLGRAQVPWVSLEETPWV